MSETHTTEVTLNEQDHLEMWRLMYRRSLKTCYIPAAVAVGLVIVFSAFGGADVAELVGAAFAGAFVMGLFVLVGYLALPYRSRKVFAETASLTETQTYTLDEAGFSIAQESGETRAKWRNILKWDENDAVFLIHPNSMLAYLLPKAQISPEIIDFAKRQLASSGLQKARHKRK